MRYTMIALYAVLYLLSVFVLVFFVLPIPEIILWEIIKESFSIKLGNQEIWVVVTVLLANIPLSGWLVGRWLRSHFLPVWHGNSLTLTSQKITVQRGKEAVVIPISAVTKTIYDEDTYRFDISYQQEGKKRSIAIDVGELAGPVAFGQAAETLHYPPEILGNIPPLVGLDLSQQMPNFMAKILPVVFGAIGLVYLLASLEQSRFLLQSTTLVLQLLISATMVVICVLSFRKVMFLKRHFSLIFLILGILMTAVIYLFVANTPYSYLP